jgi:hypothetical protein
VCHHGGGARRRQPALCVEFGAAAANDVSVVGVVVVGIVVTDGSFSPHVSVIIVTVVAVVAGACGSARVAAVTITQRRRRWGVRLAR